MSSSNNILRGVAKQSSFAAMLKPINVMVQEAQQQIWAVEEVEQARLLATAEGKQVGFDEGYGLGRDKGEADGYQIGYAKGMRDAQEEFDREHAGLLTMFAGNLQGLADDMEQKMAQWFVESEEQLAALALEIARRALSQELTHTRESVLSIAREALAEVRSGTTVRIRVNPMDASVIESRKAELLETVSSVRGIEVVSDQSVLSGCLVEADGGLIDSRIETYLDRLARDVKGEAA